MSSSVQSLTPPLLQSPPAADDEPEPGAVSQLIIESDNSPATILELPARVSSIHSTPLGEVYLGEASSPEAELLLEPVRFHGKLRLVLVNLGSEVVRVNDFLAPHALLLCEGDQFSVGGRRSIEVATYYRPALGLPPSELIGVPCALCRNPIVADTRVLQCVWCGAPLHLEAGPGNDLLKCAELALQCPACTQPLQLREGYCTTPQFLKTTHSS